MADQFWKGTKLFHRIKHRNSVQPKCCVKSKKNLRVSARKRRCVIEYMRKIVEKGQNKVVPLSGVPCSSPVDRIGIDNVANDFREFCRKCPTTAMPRFLEKNIWKLVTSRKLAARNMQSKHRLKDFSLPTLKELAHGTRSPHIFSGLLDDFMKETRKEYLKATQRSGVRMKVRGGSEDGEEHDFGPYKYLGRTRNYATFLRHQKTLQAKFLLHYSLIRRVLHECVTELPYEMFDLNKCLKQPSLEFEEFQDQLMDYANDSAQHLQEFYRKIVTLVERDNETEVSENYISACSVLLSINMSRTIAHTLLHVVNFTGSGDHVPYLKLHITFSDRIFLEPDASAVVGVYTKLLRRIITAAQHFGVLEKYKTRGCDNKYIQLCLTDEFIDSCISKIDANIKDKYEPIRQFIKEIDGEFSTIYGDICESDVTYASTDLVLDEGCDKIVYFRSYLRKIAYIPDNAFFSLAQLVLTDYRETLQRSLEKVVDAIFSKLSAQHEWENTDICDTFQIIHTKATQEPITTEQVIEVAKYMGWVRDEYLDELKERVFKALEYLTKLIQLGPLTDDHMLTNARAINWTDEILPVLEGSAAIYEQLKFEAEEKLQKVIEEVTVDIRDVYPLLDILDSIDDITNVRAYLNSIILQMTKIRQVEARIEWINQEEVALSFPKSTYSEFEELKNYVYPFYHLLKLCLDVQRNLSVWLDGQFDLINYDTTSKTVAKYHSELMGTQKAYRSKLRQAQDENLPLRFKGTVDDPDMLNWPAPLKLCSKAIKLILDFQPSLTVIKIMCNEALMKRHWIEMSEIAGFDITPNAGTTLRKMIKIDLTANIENYESISMAATKERELLENLTTMQGELASIDFVIDETRDVKTFTGLGEVEAMVDDHFVKIVAMRSSIFYKPCEAQVKDYYRKLKIVRETIHCINRVQLEILRLFPILSPSERDQSTEHLQDEVRVFQQVFEMHKKHIDAAIAMPSVEPAVLNTSLLSDLSQCCLLLEQIRAGVDGYIEKVRDKFPRLYFISNDGVLRILACSGSPGQLRDNLRPIFSGIRELRYNDRDEICEILNSCGEIIRLRTLVKTDSDSIEDWLMKLEKETQASVRAIIKECLEDYKDGDDTCFEAWLRRWQIQALLVVTRILFNMTDSGTTHHTMERLVNYIKSNSSNGFRSKLSYFYISIANDYGKIIKYPRDFQQLSQPRYSIDRDTENVLVRIFYTTITYGNEVLGDSTQIVLTPEVDRCYLTLILAYSNFCHALCQGLSGTGKSETLKSLATILGLFYYFHTCTELSSFNVLSQLVKGAYKCGSWLFIQCFHTLRAEVASALAQQISDSVITSIDNRFFISLTTNEIAQSTLPEQLRMSFRSFVCSVPDYQIIAEIALNSYGFRESRSLSKKIVTSQEMFLEIFPEHDFGLRMLRRILEHCCCAFKGQERSEEEKVVANSIRVVNQTKLSNSQEMLLNAIIEKIFHKTQQAKKEEQMDFLAQACSSLNLQPTKNFLMKATEVHDLVYQQTRGIILVGKAFTGKTSLINTLTFDGSITKEVINHKTFTLDELYGFVDTEAGLWKDGIITTVLRRREGENFLIVLDGPIDSCCFEHLNSVLNEEGNMCLSSGDVLYPSQSTTVVFEVEDLNTAAPSMVSRCGVVYMDRTTLPWQSLVHSWISAASFEWLTGHEEYIFSLFEWLLQSCLEFARNHCHQILNVNDLCLVKTVIQLVEIFLTDALCGPNYKKEEDAKNLTTWIQASFLQAGIWSFCSVLDSESRVKFDEFYKRLWRGQDSNYPFPKVCEKVEVSIVQEGMIFEYGYVYKAKGTWKFWPDILKSEKIEESSFHTELFVPTVESVKYASIVNMHINHGFPVLLIGPRGTGKTSLVLDILTNKVNKDIFYSSTASFSRKTTAREVQELLWSMLDKKINGRLQPAGEKNGILFIDDFNMPLNDNFETQSSMDLLRQFFDQQKLYDFYIDNLNIVAALDTNDALCPRFSQRTLRHFNIFSINDLHEESVARIFSNILQTKWKKLGFPSDSSVIVNQITIATLRCYKEIKCYLKPSSIQQFNRFQFELTNVSKVMQGCCMVKKEAADVNKKLSTKLWAHEMLRVFGDRLIENDWNWLCDQIKLCIREDFNDDPDLVFENLPKTDDMEAPDLSQLQFGSFDSNSTVHRFDEIDAKHMEEIFKTFNSSEIVLFDFALKHLCRICRILAMPSTNLLQLGICGSGRKTLVQIACNMYKYKFFDLEVTPEYNKKLWRKTVRSVLQEAGGYNRPCVFFLREDQIKIEDYFLEDIDQLLKISKISGLYSNLEEMEKLLDLVRTSLQKGNKNLDIDSHSVFLHYQKQCHENLHIILSCSNTSSYLKKSVLMYPSLLTNCCIDYYEDWPKSALESVARIWIEKTNIIPEIKHNVVQAFSYFHKAATTDQFHLTSGSYLEFVTIYVEFLKSEEQKILTVKQKYLKALEKLSFAAMQIAIMQKSLAEYQPQLEEMTKRATDMTNQIEKETIEVEKVSNLVRQDEKTANEQAAAAQILKLDCEADLAQAIPILEDAISALNTLKPTDITLVKSMKNPPDAIKLVMAAVCVIKDVKPDRIPDPSTGRKALDYWGPSKRILGDMNFLQTLKDFDKDHIKPEIMVKIRKDYLPHKDFKPHVVAKASSAAEGLCKWIIAMDMYDKVAKEVAPKKEKLEKAEQEYANTLAILNEKKEQVARIEQKLADLNALLDDATRQQQRLQRDVNLCQKKLGRAQKLIGGLSEEKSRWDQAVESLEIKHKNLAGDMLVLSGTIAYLGPFNKKSRYKIKSNWLDFIQSQCIPCKLAHELQINDDLEIQEWFSSGLPHDPFFVEGGLIARESKRLPLFLDPQNEATAWLKKIELLNGIQSVKFLDYKSSLKAIDECMDLDKPLLIEQVENGFMYYFYPQLCKGRSSTEQQGFKLYLTTKMSRETVLIPEVHDKFKIINFALTSEAVEEQLLTDLIEVEKPSLKQLRKRLVTETATNKAALNQIEEKILKTLSESQTDILEDEKALLMLDDSKVSMQAIELKQKDLKDLKKGIDSFRDDYRTVAKSASCLYFCLFGLRKLNNMYCFSVEYFNNLYLESIRGARKSRVLEERKNNLIEQINSDLYTKVSRSVFEEDKLLLSFIMSISLLEVKEELRVLLDEHVIPVDPNPAQSWLTDNSWSKLCKLENFERFKGLKHFFIESVQGFEQIFYSFEAETLQKIKGEIVKYFCHTKAFAKFLILSIIRPDKTHLLAQDLVKETLGTSFVNPPFFDIYASFMESHILSPLIFITRPESDAVNSLKSFARKKNYMKMLRFASPEIGREDIESSEEILALIEGGHEQGLWICIQNCHLFTHWLPKLEQKLDERDYSNTHENFRLWLMTNETETFPSSLLEKSVKITRAPPRGLKRKMANLFKQDPIGCPGFFKSCPGFQEIFTHLLYALALFHSIILDRQIYWKIPYKFSKHNFNNAIIQLQNSINIRKSLDIAELLYIIGDCNYASNVVNKWEKRLVTVLLRCFLDENLLTDPGFLFNGIQNYGLPIKRDHQDYLNHISKMSDVDNIAIFGLHDNYESIKDYQESYSILKSVLRVIGSNNVKLHTNLSSIQGVDTIQVIIEHLPKQIEQSYEGQADTISSTVIVEEVKSYNNLLQKIFKTLSILRDALDGTTTLSPELEDACKALVANKVPGTWIKFSNNCCNSFSLAQYLKELAKRVEYFRETQLLSEIWLGAFFRPRSFIMSIALAHCNVISSNLDEIQYFLNNCETENQENMFITISGLTIVGARWDLEENLLDELPPRCLQQNLPPVSLILTTGVSVIDNYYEYPLYKTISSNNRKTTGFISAVLCASKKPPEHWVKRGVAFGCQFVM